MRFYIYLLLIIVFIIFSPISSDAKAGKIGGEFFAPYWSYHIPLHTRIAGDYSYDVFGAYYRGVSIYTLRISHISLSFVRLGWGDYKENNIEAFRYDIFGCHINFNPYKTLQYQLGLWVGGTHFQYSEETDITFFNDEYSATCPNIGTTFAMKIMTWRILSFLIGADYSFSGSTIYKNGSNYILKDTRGDVLANASGLYCFFEIIPGF